MKKNFKTFMLIISLITSGDVLSATIGFSPNSITTSVGNSVNVDIVISGLDNNSSPSLGAFDLDVNYDASILGFNSVVFGSGLDLFGFGTINGFSDTAGKTNIFELSFDSESDLNSLQADSFLLASISFNAIADGNSLLNLNTIDFADGAGDPLVITTNTGNVTVNPVPAPPAIWLLGTGLPFIYRFIRKERKNEHL